MFLTLIDLEDVILDDGSRFVETALGEKVVRELKRLQAIDDKPLMPYNEVIHRKEDMSCIGQLTLFRQEDGDIVVGITDKEGYMSSVEFCVPGSGGGKSPHTLKALSHLGIAMIKDNNT